jgi:exopolysaccharide production protein ExoZ
MATDCEAELKQLYSIQYVRALAALAVVLAHTATNGSGNAFRIGLAGVDIFFVISGFVMWITTASRAQTPAEFIANRIARIVPMYWLVTLSVVVAAACVPALFSTPKIDAGHIVASLLFIPSWSPFNGKLWPVLGQGWTLNYEMFFYAVFALVLFMPRRLRLAALSMAFCGLALSGVFYAGNNPLLLVYTDSLMLEFLAGIFLGVAYERNLLPSWRLGCGLSVAGIALLLTAALTSTSSPRIVVFGIPAVCLVLGLVAIEARRGIWFSRVAATLGDASYSIYLTHGLFISALAKGAPALNPVLFVAICPIVAAAAGVLIWKYLERPLTSALRRHLARQRQLKPVPALPAGGIAQ